MEKGAPYEGRFARKQGRSPPLWSFAHTGFILAVCTPLAIAPVPAAAQEYYKAHSSGGFGAGPRLVGGIVGGGLILEKVIHDYKVLWQLKKDGLLSFDQYQRQLQDLEAAKLLSINKCPAAPHIPGAVKAEFQEGDRTQAIALLLAYGLEAKINDSVDLTKITVPAGQEWFWVDILRGSGLFAHVGWEDYYCPKSIARTIDFGIVHPDVSPAAPRANIPRADDLEDVVALLKAKYPKPTEIRVTDRNQRVLKVEVNGLRGSVLTGHNYWERLEIHLVLIKPGEIEAMVEGSYATGIGDSPPATSAYQSMEKDYFSDISRYTKLTFANLQSQ